MGISGQSTIREAVLAFVCDRLGGRLGGEMTITIDLVNLDRGGNGGLVYYGGAIVRRRGSGEVLDGLHRLHAVVQSGVSIETKVSEVGDDPVEAAIYVPAGPTPDYVVDHETRTILIGTDRGDREATLEEMREAAIRAMTEFFGN